MIPYGQHTLTEDDIAAVVDVLKSERITQGNVVPQFESAVRQYCKANYSLAVSSGTAALHLACLALDLGPGDILWTTPNTFVASANCALYCGAEVDFVDIDPRTYNMSTDALQRKLEQAKADGRLPKILIPVHFSGQPCDMKEIAQLADEYGFYIIEDACHAMGASYDGEPVGTCRYSDISVFSFHPVKMITTGEGGMLLTNEESIFEKAQRLRSHGIERNSEEKSSWVYEQTALGFNYRLTDIQAALGLNQLSRLDASVKRRTVLAKRYSDELKSEKLVLPWQNKAGMSSWHLYVVQVDDIAGQSRENVYRELHAAGIGVNVHYIPVHTQPYYTRLGFTQGQYPVAEAYYQRCLTLPLYPSLSDAEQEYVIGCLKRILNA